MAIEILLIVLGAVVFGGMVVGMFLTYRETESERARAAAETVRPSAFFGWTARDAAIAEELMLRQIEHHLRREAQIAEAFILDPNPQTLRAGGDQRIGLC